MTQPRHVLTLIDRASDQGGAERFAMALATAAAARGWTSTVCATRAVRPEVREQLRGAGVKLLELSRRTKWDVHRLRELTAFLRAESVDVLHAHMFGSNLWGTISGRLTATPVVLAHEHNWSYSGERMRIWVDRNLIGRLATRFVAVSEANRQRMIELEGIPAERIVVLPTAYIPHRAAASADIRRELGIADDVPVLAVAATLRPEKALHLLIEAVARLRGEFPGLRLLVAGDGERRAALEEQAAALEVAEMVHFLGARRDVSDILHRADIGVLCSEWEGMPLFVFECMFTRTALVASAVGGIPEVVRDGETGVLVPPGDVAWLAAGIARLIRDPGERERIVERAAAAASPYSIELISDRFLSLYEELLADARRGPR